MGKGRFKEQLSKGHTYKECRSSREETSLEPLQREHGSGHFCPRFYWKVQVSAPVVCVLV